MTLDDPELWPEDDNDPDEAYPGDPPVPGPVVTEDLEWARKRNPDLRSRRKARIDEMLATREYRNGRREELRSRYGAH